MKERGQQEAIAMVEKFRNRKEIKKNSEEETQKQKETNKYKGYRSTGDSNK